MSKLFVVVWLGILTLAGCATRPTTKVGEAIDLCGSIGKLQAANTHFMTDIDSTFVEGRTERKVTYPELTPDLRLSAMRSTAHCINLHLGKIDAETYDRLMALEANNAAAVENALTGDQLESLIAKGYKKIADILHEAGVSRETILKLAAINSVNSNSQGDYGQRPDPDDPKILLEIRTKIENLDAYIRSLPSTLDGKKERESYEAGKATELVKVHFAPSVAKLDAEALLTLHKIIDHIAPDTRLSVVGSADSNGDAPKNLELSRQRAQTVAQWLINNRKVEPRRIHVGARGAKEGNSVSAEERYVAVYKY